MTTKRMTLRATAVAVAAATLAATITMVLIGGSWLAFAGWLIFFASIQLPLLLWLAGRAQLDRCAGWLLGRHSEKRG
jgi:hypothetical protein